MTRVDTSLPPLMFDVTPSGDLAPVDVQPPERAPRRQRSARI